jgi:hypothetical protein
MKTEVFSAVILVLFFIVSCKKDTAPPDSTPEPDKASPRIAIKLNIGYVTPSKIDSAVLLWEIAGKTRVAPLHLSNDTLYAITKDFRKGAGRLTVQIFSSVKLPNESLQFEKRTEVTLKEKQAINWAAPASYEDLGWNPASCILPITSKKRCCKPTRSVYLPLGSESGKYNAPEACPLITGQRRRVRSPCSFSIISSSVVRDWFPIWPLSTL